MPSPKRIKSAPKLDMGPVPVGSSKRSPISSDQLNLEALIKTFGDSGTARWGGFFQEEFNPDFRGQMRISIIEEMRRSDGAVKAVLHAIKSPLLSTDWTIECEDEKIKEFADTCLFKMKRSWNDFLREAMAYLDFGFYVFEKIYEVRDGLLYLVDLSPRIPRSIFRWRLSDNTFGVQQTIRTDEFQQDGLRSSVAEIPGEKLLIFTNDKEGDDITGQSVLRPAYKHWKYKDVLYAIQGIAAERYGIGTPMIKLPAGFGATEKDNADQMGATMRGNESSHIVIPANWEVDILSPKSNSHGSSMEAAIDHHNRMILMACLANFLDLGSGAGSFALSKDQSSFFLKHDDQVAVYLQEQIIEQVIRPLVVMNFGEDAEIPKLKHSQLGDIDLEKMATNLKTLVDGGLIQVDPELMQFIRKMFKLPPLSDEEVTDMQLNELQRNIDEMMSDSGQQFEDEENPPEQIDTNEPGVGNEIDDGDDQSDTVQSKGGEGQKETITE